MQFSLLPTILHVYILNYTTPSQIQYQSSSIKSALAVLSRLIPRWQLWHIIHPYGRVGYVVPRWQLWYIIGRELTSPWSVSELSISIISCMKSLATERRASSGHSENQSIVQQVTKLGNCRRRDRNTSPIGLERKGQDQDNYFESLICQISDIFDCTQLSSFLLQSSAQEPWGTV